MATEFEPAPNPDRRKRMSQTLLWTGVAPLASGVAAWCWNPLLVFTALTVVAFVFVVITPRRLRQAFPDPTLFPSTAAGASLAMGVVGLILGLAAGALELLIKVFGVAVFP
jgi:hypothetical protein